MTDSQFWKDKNVYITGHTGFKGSWLSLWLTALGARVHGYAMRPPTEPSLFELCRIDEQVTSTIADVRDLSAVKQAIMTANPDIVFHMAAQSLVRDSYKIPVDTFATNVMGTVNLLEAVRSCKTVKAVIVVTTDKCYENREWVWGYRESEPLGGHDPYSSSKACSELVTAAYRRSFFNPEMYHDHGVAIATGRAGNVIGGGDWAADRLVPDWVRAILNGEKVIIRNPGAVRPWQYVLEPLSGYLMLARKLYEDGPRYGGAWNFGPNDDDAKPVEWLVKRLCALWGRGASYVLDQGQHHHEAHYLKLDCSKAKDELRWHPRWNLSKTVTSVVEWTRAYKEGQNVKSVCLDQIAEYSAGMAEV